MGSGQSLFGWTMFCIVYADSTRPIVVDGVARTFAFRHVRGGGGEFDVAETVVVRKLRGGVSVSIGSSYLANGCGGKRTNKERGYRVEHTGRGTHPVAIAIAGDAARYGR